MVAACSLASCQSGGWVGILSSAVTDSDRSYRGMPVGEVDGFGRRQTMQIPSLGAILALLAPAALQGPGIRPADLAGDWVLALDLYGETNHQRMTVETTGDRITVATWGRKLEGGIRDGRLELKWSGKGGPPGTMSGTVERDGMAGDFSIEDL